MNRLQSILTVAAAFVAVFIESSFDGFRDIFGAQIDFLPALIVYAGLNTGFYTIGCTAVLGGIWFDSMSANPLGVSVLPLLVMGLLIHRFRELLAREQIIAQFALGTVACGLQPLAVLFLLLNMGAEPLLGWKSIWQWMVMAMGGGLFTPLWFGVFYTIDRTFYYQPTKQMSFRPDRQIKRGRF